jgi:hypothetical protein
LPLGYPDYRAGLKGRRGSFIVEAKRGNYLTKRSDIEQAHSYAAHAQVGANYFMLCDGRQLSVYETLSGPDGKAIVDIPINQIDERFHELESLLSPKNLEKNCHVSYDLKLKLCDGLGSSVKIHSGEYGMAHWEYRVFMNGVNCTEQLRSSAPKFIEYDKQLAIMANEFNLQVVGDSAERDASGRISAQLSFSGVTKSNLAGMKLLGIDKAKFVSNERFLSTDSLNPSVFESTAEFSLEKGTMMPQLFGGAVSIDSDVAGDFFISGRIHKEDDLLLGEYVALADYRFGMSNITMELDFFGKFVLKLNL